MSKPILKRIFKLELVVTSGNYGMLHDAGRTVIDALRGFPLTECSITLALSELSAEEVE